MWNGLVSILYTIVNQAIFRFADTVWQHPNVSMMILLTILVLTFMMWIEILAIIAPAPKSHKNFQEIQPIRLRRS